MRWKTTAVLALLLAAFAGFYYVYEIRLAPEREKAQQAKGRLWTVEAKDVEEVVFKRKADTVHLKREGDGWSLLSPVQARGDKGPADDVVANLVTAKVDREIDPNPGKLDDFGLDPPAVEVTLKVRGKAEPLALLLGGKNPTGVWVYAKEKAKPAVFVLSEFTLRDASKPASDFRDKTILAFNRADVTQLEISHRGQQLAAERARAPSEWKVVKPRARRADWERLSDFIDKLQFTKIKEFVADAPRSVAPYGLDQPTRVTLWTGTEKGRTAKTLLLGKLDAAKRGVYAMRQGEAGVFLVGEEIWNVLPKSEADLRDKTVLDYDRDKIARIELESPKGRVVLARENDKWQIKEPEALKADEAEVGGLLGKLKDLKAQTFVAEGPAAVGRYLTKPEVKVSLLESGGQTPKTVLLGPAPEKRDGKTLAYAAVVGQGPVVLVDSQALKDLARSATDLRDRSLLGLFDPKDVRRFQVRSGGQVMLVQRKGDADWRVVEPKKGRAREARVNDLLFTLRNLKWSELVSPKGEDAARYGFDAPSFEVTLWKADGGEIGTLVVGKKEAEKTYLKTKASPAFYAVESRQLGDFPKIPDDFLS
ncbi:MAG: DUF4340 domain-containing protein [Candidatus Rokubacteria bacterium]|nr:DUF4340 domain-containing protein [Candidatus Rokubacteria bacterium]